MTETVKSPDPLDIAGLEKVGIELRTVRDRYTMACPDKPDAPFAVLTRAADAYDSLLSAYKAMEAERDDLQDRVDELEADAEIVSNEFEKDCWVAMRWLLKKVGWTDFSEGVTADLAREIIWDAIQADQTALSQLKAEVREALTYAADVRFLELAQGASFTIIDRQMLGELHSKARRALSELYKKVSEPDQGSSPDIAGMEKALDAYDAGLLGDGGGGSIEWWQDYIRAELARAHEHYEAQHLSLLAAMKAERDEQESLKLAAYTCVGETLTKLELRAEAAETALSRLKAEVREIGRIARSDGGRTFDDCIRDLWLIDDRCRALSDLQKKVSEPSTDGGEG